MLMIYLSKSYKMIYLWRLSCYHGDAFVIFIIFAQSNLANIGKKIEHT